VYGCICPELGAHCLLRLVNKNGDSIGECCIVLGNLMSRNMEEPSLSELRTVSLTSGGTLKGIMSAQFSLKILAVTSALALGKTEEAVKSTIGVVDGGTNPLFSTKGTRKARSMSTKGK
jgi:hypothetical protein